MVRRYKEPPFSYAIFEICLRDEPRREDWERAGLLHDKEAQLDMLKAEHPAEDKMRRCGIPICNR